MRQFLGLAIGVVVGTLGSVLFQQSLPPEKGSVAEHLEEAEMQLRRAQQEIATLTADGRRPRRQRSVGDGMRTIAERLRDGEEVSPDHIFWTMKPWLRDMLPLMDRMRAVQQDEYLDTLAGQYARKYDLPEQDRDALKRWLRQKGEEQAARFQEVVSNESSGFVDLVRVSQLDRDTVHGIDGFMEARLEGEALDQFKQDRLLERVASVEQEANRRLQRLDEVVELDGNQLDDVFAVMARGSDDFQPGMEFDGMGSQTSRLEREQREAAIRSVLRPDQLVRYEQFQEERRADAEREMQRIGLTLPKDWQLLDDEGF